LTKTKVSCERRTTRGDPCDEGEGVIGERREGRHTATEWPLATFATTKVSPWRKELANDAISKKWPRRSSSAVCRHCRRVRAVVAEWTGIGKIQAVEENRKIQLGVVSDCGDSTYLI